MSIKRTALAWIPLNVAVALAAARDRYPHSALHEVPFHEVRITDAFWMPPLATPMNTGG
jgi:hypothetical protein